MRNLTNSGITAAVALVAAFASAISAYFAGQQSEAAWKANELNHESYVAVQRPFVTAKTLEIIQNLPSYWTFNVVFQNSGNTPTQDMQYTVRLNCSAAAQRDPEDDFREMPPPFSKWYITLGPHTETSLPFGTDIALPSSFINKMAKDRSFCFISGAIHYRDYFASSEEHISKFCYAIGAISQDNGLHPTYSQCVRWNCADKDCERDSQRYERAGKVPNSDSK